ncbi:hypothetical protein U3A55_02675 [Salarchaeum sp. III]|uniref:hypothetical protein n=1 Tax=Salarchaeum sp. III TaxID=3107927 RepID=UPI002ED89F96
MGERAGYPPSLTSLISRLPWTVQAALVLVAGAYCAGELTDTLPYRVPSDVFAVAFFAFAAYQFVRLVGMSRERRR